MPYRLRRKRLMSEINVVPYIDVMLVLLVIFMITAPLLTRGIQVELPQAAAQPVDTHKQEPLVVTVDRAGRYFVGGRGVSAEELRRMAAAILRQQPQTPVLVKGDKGVEYGKVVELMALLQEAGAPGVGLITEPLSRRRR